MTRTTRAIPTTPTTAERRAPERAPRVLPRAVPERRVHPQEEAGVALEVRTPVALRAERVKLVLLPAERTAATALGAELEWPGQTRVEPRVMQWAAQQVRWREAEPAERRAEGPARAARREHSRVPRRRAAPVTFA